MAITNASRLADFGSGIGTQGSVIQVDNANKRVGLGTTNPQSTLQVGIAITMDGTAGVITAQSYHGDGSNLTNVGITTEIVNAVQLNVSGIATVGTGLSLADNVRAKFGTGGDLAIYHDGSNSYIEDANVGSLKIGSDGLIIQSPDYTETMATFTANGAVDIYYNNSKKLETTGYGLTISGGACISGVTTALGGLVVSGVSTLSGTVAIPDSTSLTMGDDDDLELFHTAGGNSYIKNNTGELEIRSNTTKIFNKNTSQTIAGFTQGSSVGITTVGILTAYDSITVKVGSGSTELTTALSAKASTGKAIAMAMVFGF